MRKKLALIFCLFFFIGTFAASDAAPTTSENTGFITTGDTIKKLEAKRLELNSKIKAEEERANDDIPKREALQTQMSEIDNLLQVWNTLNAERIKLSDQQGQNTIKNQRLLTDMISQEQLISTKIISFASALGHSGVYSGMSFTDLSQQLPAMRLAYLARVADLTKSIEEAQAKKEAFLADAKKQLTEVAFEIDRLKKVRNDQMIQSMKRVFYYISIFLALYLAKVISKKILSRFERDFSKSHQQAIQLVHKWIFIVLFIITFLVLFLSEFVSLLPFIAIIGTGIGLGLRDVIYSFIAWFAVGSDSGYQEGDIIEVENTLGRVYAISPILTTLEEYGPQGVTGKLTSIPNKTIFEKNIKNWSRTSGYTMLQFEFLFTHDSDIIRARDLLMEVIGKNDLGPYYHARKDIENLKNTYGYSEKDLHTQINTAHDARGIILRAKVLVHVHKRIEEQSRISEEFILKIQKEKKIHLKEV